MQLVANQASLNTMHTCIKNQEMVIVIMNIPIPKQQAIILTYEPNSNFSIRAEWARSKYQYRIPGPLTDSMFHADPTQATRSRNYFSPDIHVPSVTLNWQIASQTKLQFVTSAVLGKRNSVQFDKPTNVTDTINTSYPSIQ